MIMIVRGTLGSQWMVCNILLLCTEKLYRDIITPQIFTCQR